MKTQNIAGLMAILVSLMLVVDTLASTPTNGPCIRIDVSVVEIESSTVSNLFFGTIDGHSTKPFEVVAFISANDMVPIEKQLNSIDIGANILARMSSILHYDLETVLTTGGNMMHYIDCEKDDQYKVKSIEGPMTKFSVTPSIDGDRVLMHLELVRRELQERDARSDRHHLPIGAPLVHHQDSAINISVYRGMTTVFQCRSASNENGSKVFFFVTLTDVDEKNKEKVHKPSKSCERQGGCSKD
ncbi:MAG: hypothetical protein EOM62_11880 [Bacteroidia bacterium]|nr:hypothetical protein [Bacteroidia bacterium]